MKEVAPVRRELGIRTVFNLLGPLSNPARATHQVVGVADDRHVAMLGEALAQLGGCAGAVVHATSGIDEISGDAPAHVYRFAGGEVQRFDVDPAEFDIHASRADIAGGEPAYNAAALRAILEGERSPRSDVVALNAALVFLVADRAASLGEGLELARESLRSGAALAVFEAARNPDRPIEVLPE